MAEEPSRKRSRGGRRGRGRRAGGGDAAAETKPVDATPTSTPDYDESFVELAPREGPSDRPRNRRPKRTRAAAKDDKPAATDEAPKKRPTRRRTRKPRVDEEPTEQTETTDDVAAETPPPPDDEPAVAAGDASAFAALGLEGPVLAALERLGWTTPTDIQEALIPPALAGKDCLGQAKTGTGKTAAFALPMLQRIKAGRPVQALVLVPTRELASQVDDAVKQFKHGQAFKTALLYGGRRLSGQVATLSKDPEIVVGTPGRVLDLMGRGNLALKNIEVVILDEVDRMLDIGFRDDIRRILKQITHPHQTIFVSATLDEEIRKLAKQFMTDPQEFNVSGDELTVANIEHGFVTVDPKDKLKSLTGFLKREAPQLAIVFTNTKHSARRVAQRLQKEGINCLEIHGDLQQRKREQVMKQFRSSSIQVLVATDLASRGLDVMEVSHIVNYDVPEDPAVYVHRIGRTARMGKQGYAVTFVTVEQGKLLTEIEMLINKQLPQFDTPWLINPDAPPPPPPPPEVESTITPRRYKEALRRDPILEAIGLRPLRRTLGSRFRSPRKRKMK